MTRRNPDGLIPRPANPAHRYQLCVDAVADLDMDAIVQLVCRWSANVDEITRAAAQTDRSTEEISAALAAWLTGARIPKRDVNRLVNTLTQPSLIALEGLS